jgi:hypothetical protein
MIRPGHCFAAAHLLRHLRCNTRCGGLTYYADLQRHPSINYSPASMLHRLPFVMFTDSSWQDCFDTSRSTGCYSLLPGGIVDGASFVPTPSRLYLQPKPNATSPLSASPVASTLNSFKVHGLDPDAHHPILTDSQSSVVLASGERDTRRTRHIRRRLPLRTPSNAQGTHIILKSTDHSTLPTSEPSCKTT